MLPLLAAATAAAAIPASTAVAVLTPSPAAVEIKTSPFTTDTGALQRAEDFIKAFLLGFEIRDAIALLRMEDLFIGARRSAGSVSQPRVCCHCLSQVVAAP